MDLSRPDYLYMIIWISPFIILRFFSLSFFLPIQADTYILIIGNIVSFFIIYKIVRMNLISNNKVQTKLKLFNLMKTKNFFIILLFIWVFFYFLTIIYSKGLPLMWILLGDSKTYVDFGVPTLTGLLNMFRAFLSVFAYIIWRESREKKYLFFLVFFLISAFIFEANRGGGLVLLLHIVGYFFFSHRIRLRDSIKIIFSTFVLMLFLGLMEQFRYANNDRYNISDKFRNLGLTDSEPALLQIYLLPAVLYITTPVQNLNNTIINLPEPNYFPYYTIASLLPSVIREKIFVAEEKDYGALLSEVYNTTGYYTPIIRDFGYFGAFLVAILIQLIISYIHIKAKASGQYFFRLLYPPMFMCVILSPFNLYFTNLVVVSYPLLCYIFIKSKIIHLK
jgi:oligosaccharide repeat unit polymerase